MGQIIDRRQFLSNSALAVGAGAVGLAFGRQAAGADKQPLYSISLAQWSLHKSIFDKKLDNLDFARTAKQEFGIDAVEYVNQFFADKAKDVDYLNEMNKRASGEGVKNLLIMIDREGHLGDPDKAKRQQAIENHYKWVEAAKRLGCHSIRVNAASNGTYEEQQERAADGLRQLAEFGASHDLNVLVENHGGLSSNGAWLAGVMKLANHPRLGTLPDFGNFRIREGEEYDYYQGVKELMPYAKAVSAKAYDFDDNGNETKIDFRRMMKIVTQAGFHGYVGIEYEGKRLPEHAGIKATKALLERVRSEISS